MALCVVIYIHLYMKVEEARRISENVLELRLRLPEFFPHKFHLERCYSSWPFLVG